MHIDKHFHTQGVLIALYCILLYKEYTIVEVVYSNCILYSRSYCCTLQGQYNIELVRIRSTYCSIELYCKELSIYIVYFQV